MLKVFDYPLLDKSLKSICCVSSSVEMVGDCGHQESYLSRVNRSIGFGDSSRLRGAELKRQQTRAHARTKPRRASGVLSGSDSGHKAEK